MTMPKAPARAAATASSTWRGPLLMRTKTLAWLRPADGTASARAVSCSILAIFDDRVLEIEDDGVGAALMRLGEELFVVRGDVEHRADHGASPISARISAVCSPRVGRRPAEGAGRLAQARQDVVHRQAAERLVFDLDDNPALGEMRIDRGVGGGVDRTNGRAGVAHDLQRIVVVALGEPGAHGHIHQLAMLHPRGVVGEARVGLHLGLADDLEDAMRDLLGGARERDVFAVGAAIDVARRGGVAGAAGALLDLAGLGVDRGLGPEHRDHRLEQREVDDLPLARGRGRGRRAR